MIARARVLAGLLASLCASLILASHFGHHAAGQAQPPSREDERTDVARAWRPADAALAGPWPARHRRGVRAASVQGAEVLPLEPGVLTRRRLRMLGLRGGPRTQIPITSWPAEPKSPAHVGAQRFTHALRSLCPETLPDASVAHIANATLAASAAFGVDPFVLGALAYHQSDCEPRVQDSYGVGLTRINIGMHSAHLRDGAYHYRRLLPQGQLARDVLRVDGGALTPRALLDAATHLHFAAAFLRVFQAQCPAIDAAFGSAPHRHAVSHMIFGDSVRSALPEALVLTARRRLLSYYAKPSIAACVECSRGLASPLDGAPRIAIGVMGDLRDRGQRLHRGIDLMAHEGEPVRAVAAGVVISAGVELREEGLRDLPPERALRVPLRRMGPRGLFVRVAHRDGKISLYAHLARYLVRVGESVERGQTLGDVGLTGVHTSNPHLHFGWFEHDRALDPLPWLEPHVLAVDRGVQVEPLDDSRQSARMRR